MIHTCASYSGTISEGKEGRILFLIISTIVLCFVSQTVILKIRMAENLDDLTKRIDERVTEIWMKNTL